MKKSLSLVLSLLAAALVLFVALVSVPSATITEEAQEEYDEAAFGGE